MAYAEGYDPVGGVAIVGMAGRFPGASNIHEFWKNLQGGVESISHFTDEELEPSFVEPASLRNNPHYVKARGVLEGAETFDAAFFGISPREAELMDPQQRVFLETAWEALETAGYDAHSYAGLIGVFAGMTNNTYAPAVLGNRREADDPAGALQTMMGNEKDYLATKVSYKLNLRGPSLNFQTACSTSLVAVCQAFQSLLSYQCDMALAGGVSVSCPQKRGYAYYEGAIVSPDGHCRAFDAAAQGTVFSNGVGLVVLKRLQDALQDGDQIYAVIKGAAVNNDGAERASFAAPGVNGQSEVIAMAQALAGIDPETISYIEAHGTATALGDPIEIAALTQAFRLGTNQTGFCALGSVKTNIGHLDAASGVAGLIKTTLALYHKQLPPSLHFTQPNPKIEFTNSPFYVNTELKDWLADQTPRRAGVSSFGSGGTNAHVVLEEAPLRESTRAAPREQLLVFSAKTPSALEQLTSKLAYYLTTHPQLNWADIAYTLQTGRRAFPHRRMLVCGDTAEAGAVLQTLEPKRVISNDRASGESAVAFMFPGQGTQYVNMGYGLNQTEAVFSTEVTECAEVLAPHLGLDIRSLLYPPSEQAQFAAQQLDQTFITQPVLFVNEYAIAQVWRQWGITPQAMIGHSLGEYVAACVSGVFSRDDALLLLAGRARLMQSLPPGAMLAVRLPVAEVEARLGKKLSIAAINSPTLTVVSGPREEMQIFQDELAATQITYRRLATSHAFHSQMLDSILSPFGELLRRVKFSPPQIPWVSCLTGNWITAAQATDPDYWVQQLRQPVRFAEGLLTLTQERNFTLLEVGPGRTLSTLARQQIGKAGEPPILASLSAEQEARSEREAMLSTLGRLWLSGASVNWPGLHNGQQRQRVALPTYPFERKRFWFTPRQLATSGPAEGQETVGWRKPSPPLPIREESSVPPVESKEIPMIVSRVDKNGAMQSSQHRAEIGSKLRTLLSELSGIAVSEIETAVPFFEIGLDSLLLTQVSTAIQKQLGVKVTFRQLLEELSSIDALAEYLAPLLPFEERTIEHPTTSSQQLPECSPDQGAPRDAGGDGDAVQPQLDVHEKAEPSVLERLFTQQLEIMSRQLDMLRQSQSDGTATPVTDKTHSSNKDAPLKLSAHESFSSNGAQLSPTVQPGVRLDAKLENRDFGPYKPINKGDAGSVMSLRQRRYFDEFIARYTARTQASKRYAAQHRPHLADPRSVAGFRLLWKEIVYPIVTVRSSGSKLWDIDGNEYIDLTNGFGAILFGHAPPFVTSAIEEQLKKGLEIGPQSPLAGQVAELLCELTGQERAAFCNTGSEAVMAAVRIARTVTGRNKIAMFSGDYHGIFDEVLVRPITVNGRLQSRPAAPGIPANMAENVIVLDYGAPASLEALQAQAHELAAVLVEPVQSRRLDLQPKEFLQELRRLTTQSGAALICDEIVTGFRVHCGGAQALFGVQADIATYGKVIGGGMPIGVVAGKAAFMDALDGGTWNYGDDSAPEVGVTFFAGTFVRHPLALAAAWVCLNHLQQQSPELQRQLNRRTTQVVEALSTQAKQVGAPIRLTHFSSLFCFHFPPDLPYASLFFAYMRAKGVHIWDGRVGVLTTAHTNEDLEKIVQAFKESVTEMQEAGFLPASHELPPLPGARLGKDQQGNPAWFVPDPDRPGKYLQIGEAQ